MNYERKEIINNKEYRLVTICNRSKLIAKDGSAINPYKRNQKATTHCDKDGYPCFGGGIPVHRYVANGWVDGYFDGAEINHKDFNRKNYHADNLEWVTHKENVYKTQKYNTEVWLSGKQGVKNGRATFSEKEVKRIRKLYDNGMRICDIVKKDYPNLLPNSTFYKSRYSTYSNICRRKTWTSLK